MAITNIHEITSTVDKAIDYICDPQKTDNKLLVSSFACTEFVAHLEFELTRLHMESNTKNLARHIIQSFSPDETNPDEAHQIGIRLADELLNGQYEYVIATHIEKGHIHNHIIVNETNFVNGKSFGTEHDKGKLRAWKAIRDINDELCKEYNLSTIKNAERGRGKSHFEWEQSNANMSWKDKLKDAIDYSIIDATSYDDFLKRMVECGYEYKQNGDTLSFRAKGQERFTRCRRKTLGWYYEPAQLNARIERSVRKKNAPVQYQNGIVQVQKTDDNIGLQNWATLKNMQEASKAINILSENGWTSKEDIKEKIFESQESRFALNKEIKDIEKKISDKSINLKNINNYWRIKPINDKFKKSFNKDKFYRENESDLRLYSSIKAELKVAFPNNQLPKVSKIEGEIAELNKTYSDLLERHKDIMANLDKLEKARSTFDTYMEMEVEKSTKKKAPDELE